MSQWAEIISGLRGPRLALYDDVLHGRTVNLQAPLMQNLLGWLAYHRLVWQDEGRLKARLINRAREMFEREGPARDAGQMINPPPLQKSDGETSLPERGHTAGIFTQGTVEGTPGDTVPAHPAPPPGPPRPKVHDYQAELFG